MSKYFDLENVTINFSQTFTVNSMIDFSFVKKWLEKYD